MSERLPWALRLTLVLAGALATRSSPAWDGGYSPGFEPFPGAPRAPLVRCRLVYGDTVFRCHLPTGDAFIGHSLDIDRRIVVHREPANRSYGRVTTHRSGETVALLAFPDVEVRIADVLR